MKIVAKHPESVTAEVLRLLTTAESQTLRAFYATLPVDRSNSLIGKVNRLLREVKSKDAWIECDCPGAFLTPVELSSAGQMTLRRIVDRSDHQNHCLVGITAELKPNVIGERGEEMTFGSFRSTRPEVTTLPEPSNENPTIQTQRHRNFKSGHAITAKKLQRVLLWLFRESGLAKRQGRPVSHHDFIDALIRFLKITDASNETSLSESIWYSHKPITNGWGAQKLIQMSLPSKAKSQYLPTCYMVLTISSYDIDRQVIRTPDGIELKVTGRISRYANSFISKGPHLACIHVVCDPDTGTAECESAYLHPVMGVDDLYLIGSDAERDTQYVIDQLVSDPRNPPGMYTSERLTTCYRPRKNQQHKTAAPDFIVTARHGEVFYVETLDKAHQETPETPSLSIGELTHAGKMHVDERNSAGSMLEKKDADEQLLRRLRRWHFQLVRDLSSRKGVLA